LYWFQREKGLIILRWSASSKIADIKLPMVGNPMEKADKNKLCVTLKVQLLKTKSIKLVLTQQSQIKYYLIRA
tara:strand:+ start:118 stop:336 length:219 start_codon:yes stop_codon:yes gene_type:complete